MQLPDERAAIATFAAEPVMMPADEFAEVESMVPRFYLLTRMVMELSAKSSATGIAGK